MRHWVLKNGYEIHQVLSGRSNVYLIQTPETNFLIDTGKKNKLKSLIKNLNSLGIHNIDWLILTHTHFDHCQNAAPLQKIFKYKIAVHKNAAEMVCNGYTPLPKGTLFFTKQIAKIGNLLGEKMFRFESFTPDIKIENRYIFDDIEIIHTPGHSSDSICLMVGKELAIIGDSMFGIFKNSIFPPYADDVEQLIKSWHEISKFKCSTFLPGHGNPIDLSLFKSQLMKHTKA